MSNHARTIGDLLSDCEPVCITADSGQSESKRQAEVVDLIITDWCGVRMSDEVIARDIRNLIAQAYTQGRLDVETGR